MPARRLKLSRVAAVVLAGSLNRIPLYPGCQPGYKALLKFAGRRSIDYTLRALRGDARIGPICIVGPREVQRALADQQPDQQLEYEPQGHNFVESLSQGLAHFAGAEAVLIATEDMPLVTTEAVTAFLDGCEEVELSYRDNLFVSFVPARAFSGPFTHARKPFNRFRGLSVVHGNLALAEPNLTGNVTFAAKMNLLYEGRKHWYTSLRAAGLRLSLAYLFGVGLAPLLSLENMARLVSWRLGAGFIPVLVPHPGIAVDIDEAKDYAFVQAQLDTPPQDAG